MDFNLTHPSRRQCQLITPVDDRALSIWSFHRKEGRPLAKSCHTNDMAEQSLDVNTVYIAHVVEDLIQLWTVDLSHEYSQDRCINF